MTADGKVILPGAGKLERIGSGWDLERVKQFRLQADAILVGAKTVIADNLALRVPANSLRYDGDRKYPIRVCLLGRTLLPLDRKILKPDIGGTLLFFAGGKTYERHRENLPHNIVYSVGRGLLANIKKTVKILQEDWRVEKLLVEGGPSVNASFLQADLIDRYYVTICPYIFGGRKNNTLTPFLGYSVKEKNQRRFILSDCRKESDWVFLTYDRFRYLEEGRF